MTIQEEKWELFSVLGIPWTEIDNITDKDDRKFLIKKTEEIKAQVTAQRQMQQQQQMASAMAGGGGAEGG